MCFGYSSNPTSHLPSVIKLREGGEKIAERGVKKEGHDREEIKAARVGIPVILYIFTLSLICSANSGVAPSPEKKKNESSSL